MQAFRGIQFDLISVNERRHGVRREFRGGDGERRRRERPLGDGQGPGRRQRLRFSLFFVGPGQRQGHGGGIIRPAEGGAARRGDPVRAVVKRAVRAQAGTGLVRQDRTDAQVFRGIQFDLIGVDQRRHAVRREGRGPDRQRRGDERLLRNGQCLRGRQILRLALFGIGPGQGQCDGFRIFRPGKCRAAHRGGPVRAVIIRAVCPQIPAVLVGDLSPHLNVFGGIEFDLIGVPQRRHRVRGQFRGADRQGRSDEGSLRDRQRLRRRQRLRLAFFLVRPGQRQGQALRVFRPSERRDERRGGPAFPVDIRAVRADLRAVLIRDGSVHPQALRGIQFDLVGIPQRCERVRSQFRRADRQDRRREGFLDRDGVFLFFGKDCHGDHEGGSQRHEKGPQRAELRSPPEADSAVFFDAADLLIRSGYFGISVVHFISHAASPPSCMRSDGDDLPAPLNIIIIMAYHAFKSKFSPQTSTFFANQKGRRTGLSAFGLPLSVRVSSPDTGGMWKNRRLRKMPARPD